MVFTIAFGLILLPDWSEGEAIAGNSNEMIPKGRFAIELEGGYSEGKFKDYSGVDDDTLFEFKGKDLFAMSLTTRAPAQVATPAEVPTLAPSRAEAVVEWTKSFGTPDASELAKKVCQTSDGGYILVGGATRPGSRPKDGLRGRGGATRRPGSHYAYLVKTDSPGNLQWEKTLGDGADDWGFDVQQTSDGGYIIAGAHNGSGDDHDDRDLSRNSEVYLIKTDADGKVQWEKKFGGDKADKALRVQQTADGGYIIVGITASFGAGHWDVYLLKTDSVGNLEWQTTFGTEGEDWGQSVLQTPDGGYILAGQTKVGEGEIMPNGQAMTIFNVYVVRTDSAGKPIWEKTFGGRENNVKARSIKITPDGNYIIAGTADTSGKGDNDFYLLKVDPKGNMLWEKRVTKQVTRENCWDIDVAADGGYILAGETMSGGLGSNDLDVFVVRTDADGKVLWTKVIGKAGTRINEWAWGVEQTSDDGYILAGMTTSADGDKDAFLIKLAKDWNTSGLPDDKSASSDTPKSSQISREFFAFDFWRRDVRFWRGVLTMMNEDTVGFGLVGFGVGWEEIEANALRQGMHSYNWSALDELIRATAESGRVLDLNILCRTNLGTMVHYQNMDEECCAMSPPKEDADSDLAAWGMTAYQAWSDFVFNLVERYDGDGVNDAPGVMQPVIKYLQLGDEPEAPSLFIKYGGSPELYDPMLAVMYESAKRANPNVSVVRGKSNPGHIFDDDPDQASLQARRAGYMDFLSTGLRLGRDHFDIFAINFNDHYTGLIPFVRWLEAEMGKNGYTKPFLVGDARTTLYPRDNDDAVHVLPPRYPAGFIESLREPNHPQHTVNRSLYHADEVRQSLHKMLVALASGQKAISSQPQMGPVVHKRAPWQDAGLFDARVYQATGDLRKACKPVYYAAKQLIDALLGADREVKILDLDKNVFAYQVLKEGKKLFFLWHEDPFDVDAQGLTRRNQQITVNLMPFVSTSQVRVRYFVTELDANHAPIYPVDVITSADKVTLGVNKGE